MVAMQRKRKKIITATWAWEYTAQRNTSENKVEMGLWCARPSSREKERKKLGLRVIYGPS